MGSQNYWRRRRILDEFDEWYYCRGQPPLWYRRYREEKSRTIETPEDAIRGLTAILKFINEQFKKDPNFEPPDEFLKLMARIGPILDEVLEGRTASQGPKRLSERLNESARQAALLIALH